jgi:[acyl-carrier-protein] S-malonyltransferase
MKIALVFPGYGSQAVGMAKELYDDYRIVQEYFEEASNCLGGNFVKLCFASSEHELARINNAYPALFLIGASLVALLKEQGINAHMVTGYLQGFYGSLFAAGSISFPDGLYLLSKYALFYQELLMTIDAAAVQLEGMETEAVLALCQQVSDADTQVYMSVELTPTMQIIAGHRSAVERARSRLGVDVTQKDADLGVGLQSSLAQPLADHYGVYLEKVDFKDPRLALVSGSSGRLLQTGAEIKQHVVEALVTPTWWTRVMDVLDLYDVIIQVGPGEALLEIMKKRYPNKQIIAVYKKAHLEALASLVAS